ncbi:MAG: hypothetical protein ACKO9D_08555, partial [Gammaproteobacteria bacterium]
GGVGEGEGVTEVAGDWLTLRWGDDPKVWASRLAAAAADDPDRLWSDTLLGLQRLAALAHRPALRQAGIRPPSAR